MKAIAVFCIFALFAITFVQCEKTSFKNLTHNKTGLPHFAHHNRTVQVPHFPKFNKTHGIKPAFPHFNKTNILRKALKADEAEDEFFFRTNKTHQNKTHGAKPAPKFNATKPVFPKFNITKPKFNISKPVFPKFNKTNILRKALKADEAEDEELFSFFNRNKTNKTNKTHHSNKTHSAKPFPKFNITKPKFNISKPVFPKFNKTNILRHALKADEAEDEELFSFFNRNKTQNKTHNANHTNIFRRTLKADDEAEDEFFFRTNKTQNKTHGAKPFPKFNATKPVLPKFNVTKPKFNISKPAFPKFNKTNILRKALKADEAEDEELFSFFNRNKTNKTNKTHHSNKTHGAKTFPKFNITKPVFPKFNITKPKFNISKPAFPKFNSTLRHALKADEAEDDEFFFRRNTTRVVPRPHNKTHQANHTVGIARHNLTHPIINKNHTNKGFLKF